MHNKRGADVTGFLPFFIAAIIFAIVVIIGFSRGWENFLPWLFKGNNVESVVRDCNIACTTENVYGYCTQVRTLRAPDLTDAEGNTKTSVDGTCDTFSTLSEYDDYNIAKCNSFTCERTAEEPPAEE